MRPSSTAVFDNKDVVVLMRSRAAPLLEGMRWWQMAIRDTSVFMDPLERSLLVPAPGRGQYDRSLSRARRQAEQQERLLLAVAEAFAIEGSEVGVGAVVFRAGTGRNTFYEYFDDVSHALVAVRARVVSRLESALAAALSSSRTPVERLRVVSRVFFESLSQHPYEAAVGLWRERETDALSPVGRALSDAYARATSTTRAIGADDNLRALSVSAGAEALFAECVLEPLLSVARARSASSESSGESVESTSGERRDDRRVKERSSSPRSMRSKEPVDVLVDLAVRVLR
jgi:AcrR family transcriptional regulator